MDQNFIPRRITQLRLNRNISEYQLSLELGLSRGYVQAITSGRSMPSIKQLFNIMDYFGMDPSEFFQEDTVEPPELQEIVHLLRSLGEADIHLILEIVRRIKMLSSRCMEASYGKITAEF